MNDNRRQSPGKWPPHTLRRSFRLLMALLWLSAPLPASATGERVLIVNSRVAAVHQEIVREIEASLRSFSPPLALELRDVEDVDAGAIAALSPKLVIVLGGAAAQKLPVLKMPILYTLIPQHLFAPLRDCKIRKCRDDARGDSYAIYLDQPLQRQLGLTRLLLPASSTIGVLTGPFSSHKVSELETITARENVSFLHASIDREQQLSNRLNKLLQQIDVLLALPDPMIHNRNTVPHLLLTTYRYSVPVIGFSRAYVSAGAIAAVYSTPTQIAQQISDFVSQFLAAGKSSPRPGGYYPTYFSIAVNNNVARSMGLSLPDPADLEARLRELERQH